MAARILRIILDQFTVLDNRSDLCRRDHSLGPRHLPHRVRQKEQTPRGGASDLCNDSA